MNPSTEFSCKQCGSCCRWPGYVYLTEQDISRLADAMGLSEDAFIQNHTRLSPDRRRLCLLTSEQGPCVFLQKDSSCRFYNYRPQQCRDYPAKWSVADGCPGFSREDEAENRL